MKKKIFSALLALSLLLSCLPLGVSAEGSGGEITEQPATNPLITFDEAMPELVITEMSLVNHVNNDPVNNKWTFFELYNTSDQTIDLYDYYMVYDSKGVDSAMGNEIGKVQISATDNTVTMAPGEIAVIYLSLDETSDEATDIANFKAYFAGLSAMRNASRLEGTKIIRFTKAQRETLLAGCVSGTNQTASLWGLARTDAELDGDDRTDWTSWVRFSYYYGLGAEAAYPNYVDATNTGEYASIISCRNNSNNAFYSFTFNLDGSTSMNFAYGMNGAGDFREGAQITVCCKQQSPGALLNWQAAQFSDGNPSLAITAIMPNGSQAGDRFEYMTVVNTSAETVNVYDYAVVGTSQIDHSIRETVYTSAYFSNWNYLIPSEQGNIRAYDQTTHYSASMISNGARADGALAPGETAVIWFYSANAAADNKTLADFRNAYPNMGGDVKVFAIDADNNSASGSATFGRRIGLANTGHYVYGFAKTANLPMEDAATAGAEYPEIVPEAIEYENGKTYGTTEANALTPNATEERRYTGVNVSDADSFVFLNYSAVTGRLGIANETGGIKGFYGLVDENGTSLNDVAVLYQYDPVAGNRLGGYLQMAVLTSGAGNINSKYNANGSSDKIYSVKFKSAQNFWAPGMATASYGTDWTVEKVAPGALVLGQLPDYVLVTYPVTAIGWQAHLTDADTLRIVVGLDSMEYARVGVDVHIAYRENSSSLIYSPANQTKSSNEVYTSLLGVEDGVTVSYEAGTYDSAYLAGIELKDLGLIADVGLTAVITVTPWVEPIGGGEKAYGLAESFAYEVISPAIS